MSREIITPDGSIVYRTALMEPARAQAFARCLKANETRFCDVFVNDSARKNGRQYVTFRPVNRERQLDMLERQQNARAERGQTEGMDYIFWQDPDFPGSWWCFNPESGNTYQVTSFSCDCPDYVYRCDKAGCQCKHIHALQAQADAARIDKAIPVPARKPGDYIRQNACRDFA